ncbi:Las1 family protein [Perkinsela sp. CCAP 1560/4]|nr:Las1 family protein [Perkinsela sp. CCAP 1560/4]|eukprot:KNH06281.1 Las1 family protein [Perkinsela sp. CCAP 1560/4]
MKKDNHRSVEESHLLTSIEPDDISQYGYNNAWLAAHENIFSDAIKDIKLGIEQAERCILISKCEEPFIEATILIRRCQLIHHEKYQRQKLLALSAVQPKAENRTEDLEDSWSHPHSILTLAYSMSIVRMVNAVTDRDFRNHSLAEMQKMKSVHNSVKDRAEQRDLPKELVEVRHTATHAKMPSLEQLVYCSCLALSYLQLYYWQPLWTKLRHLVREGKPSDTECASISKTESSRIDEIPGITLSMRMVHAIYPQLSHSLQTKRRNPATPSTKVHPNKKSLKQSGDLHSYVAESHKVGVDVRPNSSAKLLFSGVSVPLPPGFAPKEKAPKN